MLKKHRIRSTVNFVHFFEKNFAQMLKRLRFNFEKISTPGSFDRTMRLMFGEKTR